MRAVQTLRKMLVAAAVLVIAAAAYAAELGTRSSSVGGVTVKVTPKSVEPGAAAWEFAVVLDTHSQDLSDDLMKNSVLVDAQGVRHAPLAWEGSPPGGHHRSGELRFKGMAIQPDAIELQMRRPDEPAPRSFRWKLK
ncbi:MAG: hypothetical protein OEZ09_11055 [Betaproteobacteria bacterium]|nr:hypothetical protein [Betaproteobacteria bacterium]MDH4323433.1 hypothetical protein [Betaproteobacteria bacterium]MDH5578982.1 hypothetical protein [Betaproteobacteria bacterium]